MGTGTELATAFDDANGELIVFARSCSEAQWATVVPGENWPVGVVVHHVAVGHRLLGGWVESALRGEDIHDTAAGVDAANAAHARASAAVEMEETVELLRTEAAPVSETLHGLLPDDLARAVAFGPADGAVLSVEALAGAATRHCRVHLANARAALEGA